ncbi:MAG: DUF1579 domain-containing protein [Phycisphaerae bacterium]
MNDRNRRPPRPTRRLGNLLLAGVLAGLPACASSGIAHNNQPQADAPPPKAPQAAVSKIARPGPQHKRLEALIGNWNAVSSAWPHRGEPVEEGKGTLSNFWMLDGRFVGQEYKSKSKDPPYQGLGALGYDNVKHLYTSVWLDTAGTAVLTSLGSCDKTGKVFTLKGRLNDPTTGKPVRTKSITRIVDPKTYTFELFKDDADGKMFKTLHITYTRK